MTAADRLEEQRFLPLRQDAREWPRGIPSEFVASSQIAQSVDETLFGETARLHARGRALAVERPAPEWPARIYGAAPRSVQERTHPLACAVVSEGQRASARRQRATARLHGALDRRDFDRRHVRLATSHAEATAFGRRRTGPSFVERIGRSVDLGEVGQERAIPRRHDRRVPPHEHPGWRYAEARVSRDQSRAAPSPRSRTAASASPNPLPSTSTLPKSTSRSGRKSP